MSRRMTLHEGAVLRGASPCAIWGRLLVGASEVEAIAHLGGDHARVVEVEAADGNGVVEQDSVVGDVEDVGREGQLFSEAAARGEIERGVHGKIVALIGSLAGTGKTVGEA